jgi:hypothetical protein
MAEPARSGLSLRESATIARLLHCTNNFLCHIPRFLPECAEYQQHKRPIRAAQRRGGKNVMSEDEDTTHDIFNRVLNRHSASAVEVQQVMNLLTSEGFALDAQTYEDAREGQKKVDWLAKELGATIERIPGYEFFYRRGDQHVDLAWDNEAATARVFTYEGDIPHAETSRYYTVQEFLQTWPGHLPVQGKSPIAPGEPHPE